MGKIQEENTVKHIWFWQRIVSPHMAGLARAVASMGVKVTYVAEQTMSKARAAQGWQIPDLGDAKLCIAPDATTVNSLVGAATEDSIHICQGIRANGLVSKAQRGLAHRGLRQWVVMETVEDGGWRGLVKRFEYRRLFRSIAPFLEGVLATGHRTPGWVVSRGVPSRKVFPFAYFLFVDDVLLDKPLPTLSQRFRVLFVGQFIERKRLDLLIDALADLDNSHVELIVVGSGPLEETLRQQAEQKLHGRVDWIGRLSMVEVRQQMALVDCLVLPSRHDGWGAVVSEALMVGTPVICSDHCGAAGVVQASGVGASFSSGSKESLHHELEKILSEGKRSVVERARLARWATSLEAKVGANYLLELLNYKVSAEESLLPPWLEKAQ
ncbi:glycosyltransferase [Halomonas sp. HK25]|uniref:glycosyltransferase n=1 Tax=Halomonas sp. HK25 TaxID=3394321 RepID=UPI0039FDC08C